MKRISSNKISQIHDALSSVDVQKLLLDRAKNAVLATAVELLEQDMIELCGDPFARKKDAHLCHRGGSEGTSLMLDGAMYRVRRPRARRDGAEVELPTLSRLRDRELLDQQMLGRMLRGVSTRNYEDVISGFSERTGIAKSSVSRAFIRSSRKDLDAINGGDLSGYRFVAILVDGTGVGDETVVCAVGVTDDLQKIPLGLLAGHTENAAVVRDLLASIRDRGFTFAAERILAVLDGGKALRSAVKALWGERVIIQRCWLHKLRNIKDYLPKSNHRELWRRFKKMMSLNDASTAKDEYAKLKSWLEGISHDAAKSLDESGFELLTLHSLGLTGTFRSSLSSTNLIESLIGVVKTKTGRVKNWRPHPKTKSNVRLDKALRWTASAIQMHRKKMRRLKGGKQQITYFIDRLNNVDWIENAA